MLIPCAADKEESRRDGGRGTSLNLLKLYATSRSEVLASRAKHRNSHKRSISSQLERIVRYGRL
jgi:gluconate kinase